MSLWHTKRGCNERLTWPPRCWNFCPFYNKKELQSCHGQTSAIVFGICWANPHTDHCVSRGAGCTDLQRFNSEMWSLTNTPVEREQVAKENIWAQRGKKWQRAGENCKMTSYIVRFFTEYYDSGQIKDIDRRTKCIGNLIRKGKGNRTLGEN